MKTLFFSPFRILPAVYNRRDQPRVANSGAELPSARLISTGYENIRGLLPSLKGLQFSVHDFLRVLDGPDVRDQQGISAYFVQMGQFIDHDITLSPEIEEAVCVTFNFWLL